MKRSIFRLFGGRVDDIPMTRIFVRGLNVNASIGVHRHEHETHQPIIIDIEMDMGNMPSPAHDRLSETFDYALVAQAARSIAREAHVQLVETLAARIADWALSEDPRILACAVRVSKPQALDDAEAAGVEIIRHRQ